LPGQVGEYENTPCPRCSYPVVKRRGYVVLDYQITGDGACKKCGSKIAGVWSKDPTTVGLNGSGFPVNL
jgi:pyruvate formate lyase activating enzyme